MDSELTTRLIPLGEYKKPRFLFYDCSTSTLYAIDDYNNSNQGLWLLGMILVAVPVLGKLSSQFLIHQMSIKLLSSLLAVVIAVGVSKCFVKKAFKNREIYPVNVAFYQHGDFYHFAKKTSKLVKEGFVMVCLAGATCLGLYFWSGDILFLVFFFLMSFSFFSLIASNNLKRDRAIKQIEGTS